MSLRATAAGLLLLLLAAPTPVLGRDKLDKRAVQRVAKAFFEARPETRFEAWDPERREALLQEARDLGPLPEGSFEAVVELCFKAIQKAAPKARKRTFATPYGDATWKQSGRGGSKSGLIIGLHGGGEGAGNASEAEGKWILSGAMGIYPQGVRLVHDTWNTVHGEAFVVTLIEWAKARHGVDPDRVYVAGFSMGGSGSWHLAGRHPDLFAGAIPAHGVLMASPKSQVQTPEEVAEIQYGLLPNVRNLPVYFYTGMIDRNCRPGTFLFAWDVLQELQRGDPGGYANIRFAAHENLAHAFPPGEPKKGLDWVGAKRRVTFPETLVWEYAANPYPLPDAEDKVARLPKRWFYWLHCAHPADGMQITATRRGNELDLEVLLAMPEDFAIYLNPAMIDVSKEVVVRVDGEEVYRGRPVPDLACVLESLDAKLDRAMVFDRKIPIPAPPDDR